jgi:renalase
MSVKPSIAIIGAGISGLTLAHGLRDVADITLFEKARGVGGRMSTRYAAPFFFDHGTQFFTARTKIFQSFLAPLIAQGVVAEWTGKSITLEAGKPPEDRLWFEPHYVAAPNMNSLCKHLAQGLNVVLGTEVAPLAERSDGPWQLVDKDGATLGTFDWVIATAPPAQTERLFAKHRMLGAHPVPALQGCYALMLGYQRPWDKPWIAAKLRDDMLDWLAVNSTKPARDAAVTCVVVHSRNDWAQAHIDDDMDEAQRVLLARVAQVTGMEWGGADFIATHRWRYATLATAQEMEPWIDNALRLASVGDWCSNSRIEDAWANATALATRLRARVS